MLDMYRRCGSRLGVVTRPGVGHVPRGVDQGSGWRRRDQVLDMYRRCGSRLGVVTRPGVGHVQEVWITARGRREATVYRSLPFPPASTSSAGLCPARQKKVFLDRVVFICFVQPTSEFMCPFSTEARLWQSKMNVIINLF